MRRMIVRGILLGSLLSVALSVSVLAHAGDEGAGIKAEPSDVTAGATIVLAGTGLEPDDERVLVLAGESETIDLGTAKTDGEGMFSIEITIPSHLPSGTYELRAIGDETLTTPLAITAAAGGAAAPDAGTAAETVVARDRSTTEVAAIAILVVAAAVAGGWLIWRAERFRGPVQA